MAMHGMHTAAQLVAKTRRLDAAADAAAAAAAAQPVTAGNIVEVLGAAGYGAVGVDEGWTMWGGVTVFLMHLGFAMLEAGAVRQKNMASILTKNLIAVTSSVFAWWTIGFYISQSALFPDTVMFGSVASQPDMADAPGGTLAWWFWDWAFCATASTIVSGALAERVTMLGFTIFTLAITGVMYPYVTRVTWYQDDCGIPILEGCNYDGLAYQDYAGSGIVHMTGGVAAFVGAAVLGPRKGRFENPAEFQPHNLNSVVLGTVVLWFGWYGFNGSYSGLTPASGGGGSVIAAHTLVTTTIAAAAGGITAFSISTAMNKKFDLPAYCNGILAGLVGVTAGPDGQDLPFAALSGAGGGVVYVASAKLLEKIKIDDPLGASCVHGFAGMWGVMAEGMFDMTNGMFCGSENGKLIMSQAKGLLFITVFIGAGSAAIFVPLKLAKILRVSEETEEKGTDAEMTHMAAMAIEMNGSDGSDDSA